jgi:hypothetical protein
MVTGYDRGVLYLNCQNVSLLSVMVCAYLLWSPNQVTVSFVGGWGFLMVALSGNLLCECCRRVLWSPYPATCCASFVGGSYGRPIRQLAVRVL